MGDCSSAEMRDALPELMFDDMEPSHRSSVEAHVNGCRDCAAELALLQRVRSSVASPAVDVERVVRALPAHRRRTVWAQPALRMAAALALLIGGATWYANREPVSVNESAVAVARTTPVVVNPAESVTVASAQPNAPRVAGKATVVAPTGLSLDGGLADFSDAELRSLLATLDSFEGEVVVEPAAVVEPVLDSEEL